MPQIWTIGYERRSQDEFIALLERERIERLIDVRIRAQSRKPGFSRSALAAGLARAGIDYEHLRELGTPLEIRARFRAGDTDLGRREYRSYLLDEARPALDYLADTASDERVAIMCFEFDERECHRLVISEELARLAGTTSIHLRT